MKTVEIKCPQNLDLTNLINCNENSHIFQTVNIYDKVSITSKLKEKNGIFITSNFELDENIKKDIRKLVDIFTKYNNLSISNLSINLIKNETNLINNYYNLLSGLLIGLNTYFQTNLLKHELIYIGKSINNLIGYYIEGGYKKIDINNKYHNIGENIYQKYILILDNDKKELLKVKEKLLELKVNNLKIDYNYNYYFVAITKDYSDILCFLPISLKKEFKKIQFIIANNTLENKIFVKYLNRFE